MATPSFSTNLGLSALPEYDQKKDPALYGELTRIRNALRALQAALDQIGGGGLGAGAFGEVLTALGGGLFSWIGLHVDVKAASYVTVSSDCDNQTWLHMNVAGACTITIQNDATLGLAATQYPTILWMQYGAGQITFVPGAGVTIRQASSLTSRALYSPGGITRIGANEWALYGDTT